MNVAATLPAGYAGHHGHAARLTEGSNHGGVKRIVAQALGLPAKIP